METPRAMVVVEGRVELVRPMDAAAIHDHHDVFARCAEGGHHVMEIWVYLLGIKVGHDFRENLHGAIVDRAEDAEQDAAGEAAPRTIPEPRWAFEGCLAVYLALAQRPCGETRTLGAAPPAQPREGKAPEDGFLFVKHNDRTLA